MDHVDNVLGDPRLGLLMPRRTLGFPGAKQISVDQLALRTLLERLSSGTNFLDGLSGAVEMFAHPDGQG